MMPAMPAEANRLRPYWRTAGKVISAAPSVSSTNTTSRVRRQHLHLRVVFAREQIVVAVETKSPQIERGGDVQRDDGAPADQADHRDRHQPRQHFREFRFQRRNRNGHDHRQNQKRKPAQSARLIECRIEIRVASGQGPTRELACPAMQGERNKHGDPEDHHRDQRVRQPVEQILDLGQRSSQRIHGALISSTKTAANMAFCLQVGGLPSLDITAVRWQKARVPSFSSAAAMKNFLLKLFTWWNSADLRHPVLDLALWRAGRRGRVRQSLLPHLRRQDRSRRLASSGAG